MFFIEYWKTRFPLAYNGKNFKLGVVVHVCNLSTQKAEVGDEFQAS
jgi:hypothetical protein